MIGPFLGLVIVERRTEIGLGGYLEGSGRGRADGRMRWVYPVPCWLHREDSPSVDVAEKVFSIFDINLEIEKKKKKKKKKKK